MGEHRDAAAVAFPEAAREPGKLVRLLGAARAAEQAIDADEAPVAAILQPAVGADEAAPAREPRRVDWLARAWQVPDVVVAGQAQDRYRQPPDQFGREIEVLVVVGAIDRQVPGVDHEVRGEVGDPTRERLPVVVEVGLRRAEMRVGDLEQLHGHRGRNAVRHPRTGPRWVPA